MPPPPTSAPRQLFLSRQPLSSRVNLSPALTCPGGLASESPVSWITDITMDKITRLLAKTAIRDVETPTGKVANEKCGMVYY